MAYDAGIGILLGEILQQRLHCLLLGLRAGVVSLAVSIKASFIHYAERAAVIAPGMSSTYILRKNRDDLAGVSDIVVI